MAMPTGNMVTDTITSDWATRIRFSTSGFFQIEIVIAFVSPKLTTADFKNPVDDLPEKMPVVANDHEGKIGILKKIFQPDDPF